MLKAKKKYTKKELKQDQFILATMKAKSFVEENARQITYIAVGIVVVILIAIFYMNLKKSADQDAALLLSTAQEQIRNGEKDNGIASYKEIVEQYDGTAAAGHAAFFLAKFYWEEEDLTQAKTYFKFFIDNHAGKDIMTQAAYAGYADCFFREKDYAEAAKNYEKAANADPNFPLAADYLFSAAQAYKDAGDFKKATSLSQKVIDGSNNPTLKSRAEVLLKSLSL